MNRRGIGIIGYGAFARFLHECWNDLENARVVAASARTPSRDPGGLSFHTDWRDLVARDDVDIVSITTPPDQHEEMAVEALRRGKHVLVDKPPALSVQGARSIVEAARLFGRLASVNYLMRYDPLVEALRTVNSEGVFGKLQHVNIINYAGGDIPRDHWFWDRSRSGGILVEHAVHFLDMIAYVHPSPPVRVTALASSREPGMEDTVQATVEHADGLLTTHFHQFNRPPGFERQTSRFAFDLADVDMEGWIPQSGRIVGLAGEGIEPRLRALFPDCEIESGVPGAGALELQGIAGGDHSSGASTVTEVSAGGTAYGVEAQIEMRFSAGSAGQDLYKYCARAAMADLAECAGNPGRRPRTDLESALDSIRAACAAARFIGEGRSGEVVTETA